MASKFYNWFNLFLKDRGLQFSKSGFKGGTSIGKHAIDNTTGFWENVPYSSGKPPRWIFQIDFFNGAVDAHTPNDLTEIGIGASNTSQGDKAGLAVRILPLIKTSANNFQPLDNFESNVLFIFHGALDAGSSSDAFTFNPSTGLLKRLNNPVKYIFAALLGLRPKTDVVSVNIEGQDHDITYGEVLEAIGAAIQVAIEGLGSTTTIPIYDLTEDANIETMKADVEAAWNAAGPVPSKIIAVTDDDNEIEVEPLKYEHVDIPEDTNLLGIDPAVYRQINAMLKSGKQHLMLYGPPGTGKTSLARWIATNLPGGQWTLITGSSDWSSQDIIGGYQPIGGGEVDFVPGILLREFGHPLIIDELNRCDIDKVIGPLFTVLSGQQTTLPYRTNIGDKNSPQYTILPKPKSTPAAHEFAPGPGWRLIATLNSIDKASLYQMSYALSRRFGWVYVDTPRDLVRFISELLTRLDPTAIAPELDTICPLAEVWKAINNVRVIGPAPIIDTILAMRAIDPTVEFFGPASPAARSGALDALDMVMLPMLDGIVHQDAMLIANAAITAFAFDAIQQARIKARLEAVAI
ncbi:AAA family ATPase [Pseudochrobactrum saccharolyticum]|uniref:AAA family ATPase n=1 Tax=Pseudochrobactrum saccharolyticum TaxID=354352 RepID=UPI00277523EA|nr:AAA family ATPase [Pseudochrobactrum saccharolyticum]MDP8249637.1 AAA family ATPase [Pseudochrobactrum saccharolyticum]